MKFMCRRYTAFSWMGIVNFIKEKNRVVHKLTTNYNYEKLELSYFTTLVLEKIPAIKKLIKYTRGSNKLLKLIIDY